MYIKKMLEIIDFFQKFAVLSFLIHIFSILNLFKATKYSNGDK